MNPSDIPLCDGCDQNNNNQLFRWCFGFDYKWNWNIFDSDFAVDATSNERMFDYTVIEWHRASGIGHVAVVIVVVVLFVAVYACEYGHINLLIFMQSLKLYKSHDLNSMCLVQCFLCVDTYSGNGETCRDNDFYDW